MARKRSKVRVVKPRSGKMWIESLEKRELLAASDALLTPFYSSSPAENVDRGHALSDKVGEPFAGGLNANPRPQSKPIAKKTPADDSVVVIIL